MEYRQNAELKLAADFLQFTNKNIFLTGRAGTGKTSFLHNLRKITPKRMVVVAPTGVAAINAGGVTIHSFFQLSFAPAIPESLQPKNTAPQHDDYKRKFRREKIRLIKCIDLLVNDEISMVRADTLDAVDEVLRKYRDRSKPFGGVQLLMIGDLHQLTPVIKQSEWEILKDYYESVYFFDSVALKNSHPISIELKEIFRQSDTYFIDLLNKVRDNKIDAKAIEEINTRYIQGFKATDDEGYITLTTHNANAFEMNCAKLKEIKTKKHIFSAAVEGDFSSYDFPTEAELELKVGAQVMFIKNDPSPEKCYYNGKIGKVSRIEEDAVFVKCPGDNAEIEVVKVIWEHMKYSLNNATKEIKEEVAGTFTQIPLKLAWAITIHKSQGLTFDKVIIDANAAFAFGQVYVALSRCRTFEGIVLSTPISVSGIKTDSLVLNYADETRKNEPGPEKLLESKKLFQQELILELFDFKLIKYRFDELLKLTETNSNILDVGMITDLRTRRNQLDVELFQVAEKFKPQLLHLMQSETLPEENPVLQERIKQAALYFSEHLMAMLMYFKETVNFETDNKIIRKLLADSLEQFQKDLFIKTGCMTNCHNGFETISYIRKRGDTELDFHPDLKVKEKSPAKVSKDISNPELYLRLKLWRDQQAEENNMPLFWVLPFKTMQELTKKLPVTLKELKTVKGIGKAKLDQFGGNILAIIKEYCDDNGISPEKTVIQVKPKKVKVDSPKLSFDLYKSGEPIYEIAKERNHTIGTVEGHLASYIATGELSISKFVSEEKTKKVLEYLYQNPTELLSEIKNAFNEKISYSEIRFIVEHKKWLDGIMSGDNFKVSK